MSNIDMITIVDAIKSIASDNQAGDSGGSGLRTARAITTGAQKIKMEDTGAEISGRKLYRSYAVKDVVAGSRLIVAVTDRGQGYYVLDRLL